MSSAWGLTPRGSVQAECARRGSEAVIRGCVDLVSGRGADEQLILALGGPAARAVLEGREGGPTGYWPRVWALRALLYEWAEEAASAVAQAGSDESWRVREMAAKVVAKHKVDSALETVLRLGGDSVPRVRVAAERAVRSLTTGDG